MLIGLAFFLWLFKNFVDETFRCSFWIGELELFQTRLAYRTCTSPLINEMKISLGWRQPGREKRKHLPGEPGSIQRQ